MSRSSRRGHSDDSHGGRSCEGVLGASGAVMGAGAAEEVVSALVKRWRWREQRIPVGGPRWVGWG